VAPNVLVANVGLHRLRSDDVPRFVSNSWGVDVMRVPLSGIRGKSFTELVSQPLRRRRTLSKCHRSYAKPMRTWFSRHLVSFLARGWCVEVGVGVSGCASHKTSRRAGVGLCGMHKKSPGVGRGPSLRSGPGPHPCTFRATHHPARGMPTLSARNHWPLPWHAACTRLLRVSARVRKSCATR
jgi:hypothetical protein